MCIKAIFAVWWERPSDHLLRGAREDQSRKTAIQGLAHARHANARPASSESRVWHPLIRLNAHTHTHTERETHARTPHMYLSVRYWLHFCASQEQLANHRRARSTVDFASPAHQSMYGDLWQMRRASKEDWLHDLPRYIRHMWCVGDAQIEHMCVCVCGYERVFGYRYTRSRIA